MPFLAPRNAETSPSGAKCAPALAFFLRHPVVYSTPIIPYLDNWPPRLPTLGKHYQFRTWRPMGDPRVKELAAAGGLSPAQRQS